jgi:hypothetical protein
MPSLNHLPTELVEAICEELSEQRWDYRSNRRATTSGLAALSLASSRLCGVAQPVLYRGFDAFDSKKALIGFLCTVLARPDLALLTRWLSVFEALLEAVDITILAATLRTSDGDRARKWVPSNLCRVEV